MILRIIAPEMACLSACCENFNAFVPLRWDIKRGVALWGNTLAEAGNITFTRTSIDGPGAFSEHMMPFYPYT
jgi:hypothetical protein